jgi:hypothetical protein
MENTNENRMENMNENLEKNMNENRDKKKMYSTICVSNNTKLRLQNIKREVYVKKQKWLKTYEDIILFVLDEWLNFNGLSGLIGKEDGGNGGRVEKTDREEG